MAGPDARSPVSYPESPQIFLRSLKRNFKKTPIAWSRDLGGLPAVGAERDPDSSEALHRHRQPARRVEQLGEAGPPRRLAAEQALDALEKDHEFLLRGDVFTKDVIETWFEYKRKHEVDAIRLRPHPWEFALYFDI